MSLLLPVILFIGACVGTAVFMPSAIEYLKKKSILDAPNARSNHKAPTPRGGGIAMVITIFTGLVFLDIATGLSPERNVHYIVIAGLVLAILSWLDDRHSINALLRFMVQIIMVGVGVWALSDRIAILFEGILPPMVAWIVVGTLWLWFTNLYNFMDGMDGMMAGETVFLAVALLLFGMMIELPTVVKVSALTGGAALAFLRWNWNPAKVFAGDVGSITLGFLLGWLLLEVMLAGYGWVAIILPLAFMLDSSVTLAKRLAAGKPIWQAHSEHYYQQALRVGRSHANVTTLYMLVNLDLFLLALLAYYFSSFGILFAVIAIAEVVCLFYLLTKTDMLK